MRKEFAHLFFCRGGFYHIPVSCSAVLVVVSPNSYIRIKSVWNYAGETDKNPPFPLLYSL